ncbi:MAG: archaeoflavoprotein AfpA [Candidatus Bathyarchaeota archaeon]|nr:MAG: archaeoflavoprotein AfpA [Candidatus Bathyarchaeota archaeon]
MITKKEKAKKRRVAWGITGSGDRLTETIEAMKKLRRQYQDKIEIQVYLSKAGNQVVKWYKLADDLKENFGRILIEINSNSPFLAGQLQLGKFEFLLIAPATSNTVAKISMGIADTMLSNAAIMGLKAFAPVYIMPSDYEETMIVTKLPNGRELKLRIRKEDVEHVKKLAGMADVFVLENPKEISQTFRKHFKPEETR